MYSRRNTTFSAPLLHAIWSLSLENIAPRPICEALPRPLSRLSCVAATDLVNNVGLSHAHASGTSANTVRGRFSRRDFLVDSRCSESEFKPAFSTKRVLHDCCNHDGLYYVEKDQLECLPARRFLGVGKGWESLAWTYDAAKCKGNHVCGSHAWDVLMSNTTFQQKVRAAISKEEIGNEAGAQMKRRDLVHDLLMTVTGSAKPPKKPENELPAKRPRSEEPAAQSADILTDAFLKAREFIVRHCFVYVFLLTLLRCIYWPTTVWRAMADVESTSATPTRQRAKM